MPWDLLGHEWAARLLSDHAAGGRLRHAYLFTGPRGVGRRTLALRLAQAVNCLQPQAPGMPCGACSTCLRLERMQHPDLAVLQAETEGGVLKVEGIRELQHSLSLAPYEARYRVALLLRFEEANASAANALLKTLEEPPPQVILLLTAESAEGLLPTIPSRCEVVRLKALPLQTVEEGLRERWNLEPERARLLAHLSGGRPGYALRLQAQPELLEQRQAWLEDAIHLLRLNRLERFDWAEKASKDKDTARQALEAWLSLWRDILLRAGGAQTPLNNLDRLAEIESLVTRVDLACARRAVAAIDKTIEQLRSNVNARLALEVLMLDLPRIAG
jgi:DNA polymerase III subunit delta'